jgi:hypothetical protein
LYIASEETGACLCPLHVYPCWYTLLMHDRTVFTHDGTLLTHDGTVFMCDGTLLTHDGTVFMCDGTLLTHDGTVFTHDGTVFGHDGTVSRDDDAFLPQDRTVFTHDSKTIAHDGTLLTHDRTLFCPSCFAPHAPNPMNHSQLCLCSPMREHKWGRCTHAPEALGLCTRVRACMWQVPRPQGPCPCVHACSNKGHGILKTWDKG